MFQPHDDDLEFDPDTGIALAGKDLFPDHFWTAGKSRAMEWGSGLAPGKDFVVFKSVKNGRFMSHAGGGRMKADRVDNGPWEKFRPYFLGGDLVGLKAWNNRWVCCENGG
jgi:hypothetical protein